MGEYAMLTIFKADRQIKHCKIETIHYFLKKNGINLNENILFLLGIDEFLQFGLERYKDQLLWFLVAYNEDCEKKIMENIGISEKSIDAKTIDDVKKRIDNGNSVGVYFDYSVRKQHKEKVYSIANQQEIHTGRMALKSLGIIEFYDDQAFYLNIVDLDGTHIKIDFNAYEANNLFEHTVLMGIDGDKDLSEQTLFPIIVNDLNRACELYLQNIDKYIYNADLGKYGVVGKSSYSALNEEVKNFITKYHELEDDKYLKLLSSRINILRLYQDKGSDSGFRKELGKALLYLNECGLASSFKESIAIFNKCGIYWRNFSRVLYQINMPYYHKNLDKYYLKFHKVISELSSIEENAVQTLKRELQDYLLANKFYIKL